MSGPENNEINNNNFFLKVVKWFHHNEKILQIYDIIKFTTCNCKLQIVKKEIQQETDRGKQHCRCLRPSSDTLNNKKEYLWKVLWFSFMETHCCKALCEQLPEVKSPSLGVALGMP